MTSTLIRWCKKAVISGFFVFQLLPTAAQAHGGSHGDVEGGVPTLEATDHLPKGLSLNIVKTNAEQFVLATNGQLMVEVLDENLRPFIRIHNGQVQADVASKSWHRAQMPGGGIVPEAWKTHELEAKWVDVVQQNGYGWYDKRLIDESNTHFSLALRVNGEIIKLDITRKQPKALEGYWKAQIKEEPTWPWLNTILAGKSGQAVMISLNKKSGQDIEILDDRQTPFLRIGPAGTWVDQSHRWFPQLNIKSPKSEGWVKVSDSSRLHYTDPRLIAWKQANNQDAIEQDIPFRVLNSSDTQFLKVNIQYTRF